MKLAYVVEVVNNEKKHNANEVYLQITDQDKQTYLFTSTEIKRAIKRAENNPEDIVDKEYDIYLKTFV